MSKQYELYEIMEYIKNIPHTDSPTSYQSKTLLELNNNVSNDLIQELFNSIMNNEITLLEVSQLPSIETHTITRLLTSKSAYFKKEINIKFKDKISSQSFVADEKLAKEFGCW